MAKRAELDRSEGRDQQPIDFSNPKQGLQVAFERFVHTPLTKSIEWYFASKGNKRWWGRAFRLGAGSLAGVGILAPFAIDFVNVHFPNLGKTPASVMALPFLLAGGMIWMDRFWGSTSGWLRYVKTGLEATAMRDQASLAWLTQRSKWGATLSPEQVAESLKLIADLNAQAHKLVDDETRQWMEDFRGALADLDQLITRKPASIPVTTTSTAQATVLASTPAKLAQPKGNVVVEVKSDRPLEESAEVTLSQVLENGEHREVLSASSDGEAARFESVAPGSYVVKVKAGVKDEAEKILEIKGEGLVDVTAGRDSLITVTLK